MNRRLAPLTSSRFAPSSRPGRWLAAILLVVGVALWAGTAHADNATWNGTTDATWATLGNWAGTPAAVPGTGDTATFDNGGNFNTTIDLGTGVTINTVLFDTGSAAAYTIPLVPS